MNVQIKIITPDKTKFSDLESLMHTVRAEMDVSATFTITHASSTATALARTDLSKAECFIIYLTGENDGFDDIRRIRLHKDFLFAPVIVIAPVLGLNTVADYIRHGVQNHILEKDLNTRTLKEAIEKANGKLKIWDNLKAQQQKKNDQIAIVSHDLKGPLAIIRSYMDILLNDSEYNLNEAAREKIIRSRYNADIAYDLVVGILDEFRTKKNWRMQYTKLSTSKIISESLENLSVRAQEKNIKLKVVNEDDMDIYADKKSMLQLFTNVVDNAIKYSGKNSTVTITLRSHKSAIPIQKDDKGYINIVIADEGRGIPEEKLKTIFNSYQQTRESDHNKGFGLGLSICKKICQFHMGRIWATNKASGGTSMHILLPAFSDKEETMPKVKTDIAEFYKARELYRIKDKKCILVVDDSKDIRDITRKQLISMGFEVSVAKNGLEAISVAEASKPDLILLDLNMPVLSGDEFLDKIKNIDGITAPIFIYSILKSESIFAASIRKTEGFIQKPIDPEEFVAKTKIHLSWDYFVKTSSSIKKISAADNKTQLNQVKKAKVLLVDDCKDNHDILKYYFYKSNHQLESSFSGEDAIDRLKNHSYDLVLMDLVMPGMDGYQTVDAIKNIPKKKPPIFAFSVDEADINLNQIKSKGFEGYLKKPVDIKQLEEVIFQYI